jgi:hypothetical protein
MGRNFLLRPYFKFSHKNKLLHNMKALSLSDLSPPPRVFEFLYLRFRERAPKGRALA